MAPPPPPPPPTIHRDFNIWNPGGDPGVLQRAAQAWRALAGDLRTLEHDLGQQVRGVRPGWGGKASDAFQTWAGKVGTALTDSAGQCDAIARNLDEVAAQIKSTNDQLHELYVAIGVTAAVAIGFSIVTLGFSAEAGAAAAAEEVAQATTLVTLLETFLGGTFGRWVINFGISLVATGVEKMVHNPNHLDFWDGWGPADFANALLGADMLVLAGPLASRIPGFSAFQDAHPVIAAGAISGTAGATAAFASDLSALTFEGRPLGLGTLVDVGVSGVVSGAASALGEAGARRFSASRATVTEFQPPLETPAPGRALELMGGVAEAPAIPGTVRLPSGLLTPADPPGTVRVAGDSGLLRPAPPGEVRLTPGGTALEVQPGPTGLLVAGNPAPEIGGVEPGQWVEGPGGLSVPGGMVHQPSGLVIPPDIGASQRDVPIGNTWRQGPKNLRAGTFKLPVKSIAGALNSWAAPPPSPPPGPFPTAPVVTPGAPPPALVPPPPPPHVIGGGSYTVRPGDSLWHIAHRTYGDGQLWQVLYRANAHIGANPNLIQPGQVLTIPAIAQPAA